MYSSCVGTLRGQTQRSRERQAKLSILGYRGQLIDEMPTSMECEVAYTCRLSVTPVRPDHIYYSGHIRLIRRLTVRI